jgi:L-fuconolactonase
MQRIIDSHVHFWNPERLKYDWLSEIPALNRSFLPVDLPQQGQGWQREKLIFVQADCLPEQGLSEVEWVSSLAQDEAALAGIVAFAPMEIGEGVQTQLEALRAFPLVKGVRRLIQSEALGFSTRPDFINAVNLLPNFGYTFDICIKAHQVLDILSLVKSCPNVQFVLDHCGKPNIKAGQLEPWREQIRELAEFPNLVCKLSGLVTEASHQHWQANDLRPYIEHVLDCFGIERLLFGSDWPVIRLAASYEAWIELLQNSVADFSDNERHLLFYKNAERVYKL